MARRGSELDSKSNHHIASDFHSLSCRDVAVTPGNWPSLILSSKFFGYDMRSPANEKDERTGRRVVLDRRESSESREECVLGPTLANCCMSKFLITSQRRGEEGKN